MDVVTQNSKGHIPREGVGEEAEEMWNIVTVVIASASYRNLHLARNDEKKKKPGFMSLQVSLCVLFNSPLWWSFNEEALVIIDEVVTMGLGPSSPLPELKINLYGTLAAPQIYPGTALLASQSHLF